MKFLLDENFPRSAVEVIAECGHLAIPFEEVCSFGDNDESVFAAAQRLGATILTGIFTIPCRFCTHYTLGLWLLHFVSRIVPQFIRVSGGSWRMSKSH